MTAAEQITALRELGYSVKAVHRRKIKGLTFLEPLAKHELAAIREDNPRFLLSFTEKGGETEVSISLGGVKIGSGLSVCSKKDNFCKRVGLKLALDRALFDGYVKNIEGYRR